jgi:hypothetical protein
MTCEKLRQGHDTSCTNFSRRYYQQAVLINREDIENKLILTSYETITLFYVCRHRVMFNLKEGKTGYRFSALEGSAAIYGTFDKSSTDGIPQYAHTVNILLSGVSEDVKCLLKQLDYGDYIAALQYYDGTVEIFGFEFGLSTSNYSYNPQNSDGGGVISLKSLSEAPEDEPPFVYFGASTDFDNNFQDIIFNPDGDFNDDFNDDFNNQDNNP